MRTTEYIYILVGAVAAIAALAGAFLWWADSEPAVSPEMVREGEAVEAFIQFGDMPDDLRRTADEAAKAMNLLKRKHRSEIPKLPPSMQAKPPFHVAGKYFGEGRYVKSFTTFMRGVRALGAEQDRHVIVASYTAALGSRADWLEKQLESEWGSKSDLLKRFIRMNIHWARRDYARVAELGKLQETTTQTSTRPSDTPPRQVRVDV